MDILYQDEALLVVNKPAGLSTLPDGYNPTLPHIKSMLEQQAGRLWVVHRLDKDTSGVLLLARTAEAHRSLNTQFEKHLVSKLYHALVIGDPEWQQKTIYLPLRPNGDRHHRTVVDQVKGKPAVTHLRLLERLGKYCLVEAVPETGRTHQIRAHLAAMGLSIVGDKLYADRQSGSPLKMESQPQGDIDFAPKLIEGMGLHALSLEISHPLSGQRLKFDAPYPIGWVDFLRQLGP